MSEMSVFSKIKDFLNRHRNKFIVGGVIITGSVLLTRYGQRKLREWQERETREFLERTRKQQHFESTERTCNQTILSLIGTLHESLSDVLATEEIIDKLRSNPENKLQLWEDLKIKAFARISCLIYSTVMLVITLRIQLNIIGGYLFKDPTSISTELQQKYLSLCQSLFELGIHKLSKVSQRECVKVLSSIELKNQLKLSDLENIFWSIQTSIATSDDNPVENLMYFIIPDNISDSNDLYSNMKRDTADLLDSDEVKSLMTHCINRGFTALSDSISEYYVPNGAKITEVPSTSSSTFIHPSQIQIPLAKLIPIVNGLFSKKSLPDLLVQQLIVNEKLKTLGANVYECFSYNN